MLEVLRVQNPVKTNVMQFYEKLQQRGHTCLVFEKLNRNLVELLRDRESRPLSIYPEIQEPNETTHLRAFINLLTLLLQMDPELRITSAEALLLPIVSTRHMEEKLDTSLE
ncbi:unnamed protein product [Pleuronectes platessa]|uniref:Uncharacterized protein n=1 Tax=Pleuronectes platessa TaxID=8262 RepID=A0A9N7YQB1_PLEPL|nr:unnamed protein product [Pleuronectes platessa]